MSEGPGEEVRRAGKALREVLGASPPPRRGKTWWEKQGYRRDHPVHGRGKGESQGEEEARRLEDRDIPLTYDPTSSSNPPRPRTVAAGYDRERKILRVRFRPGASRSPGGAVYDYYNVTSREWYDFRRVVSPGKFINRRLSAKQYTRIY